MAECGDLVFFLFLAFSDAFNVMVIPLANMLFACLIGTTF